MAHHGKATLADEVANPLVDTVAFEARRETPEAQCERMATTNDHSQGLDLFMAAISGKSPSTLPGELTDDLHPLLQRILS